MTPEEARHAARKAVEDREVLRQYAATASLAVKRAEKHLLERECAHTAVQAVGRFYDGQYRQQLVAWSRNEAEKPALPADYSGDLAEAGRALALARSGVEAAKREAENALNAYARAIKRAGDCAIEVLVTMADELVGEMSEARARVLSSYDQLVALMSLQSASSRNGIVLSAAASTALTSVRPLADARFPPDADAAQAPHRDRWQALLTMLTEEPDAEG